jgi:hypothetical protein
MALEQASLVKCQPAKFDYYNPWEEVQCSATDIIIIIINPWP